MSNFLSEQQHREEATGQYQLPVEHQASVCVCVGYLLLLGSVEWRALSLTDCHVHGRMENIPSAKL